MRLILPLLILSINELVGPGHAFTVTTRSATLKGGNVGRLKFTACFAAVDDSPSLEDAYDIQFVTDEDKTKAVGNLVLDDEWQGLSMELTEVVRMAVAEDIKKNAREFLGKDEYKFGDFTKEIDTRVKKEVALLRNKEDYELGDLVGAVDEMSKRYTEELTGKPYETGDLSVEIDKRIKAKVAEFCGKEEYVFGDLSREIATRVQSRVEEITGKPYEFGDVTREIEKRRMEWVNSYLGKEAAKNYQFGDLTKKFMSNVTGKDDYQFGDFTKKIVGNIFVGKREKDAK